MKLSDKIYACRTRAKLSQEELAEQLAVSRQAVSRWECGDNVPEPGKLLMLSRIFGVTTDWLLDDEQEIPAETAESAPENEEPWVKSLIGGCKSLAGRFDRMLDECVPNESAQASPSPEAVPSTEPTAAPDPAPEPIPEATGKASENFFTRLLNRFGWKLGIYIALAGILLAILSSLAQQVLAVLGGLMIPGGVI
ncbi:MAG: helix-turn-helix domain-containing protein, partial [Clostridia bacterium]|nr:helix-turn-helix domain-containing protein [Clostridia bacterium]